MNQPAVVSGASLRERFGWRAERRPEPGFGHVLAAAAGSFLVFAMVSLVGWIADDPGDDATLPGVLFSLALIAVAVVVGNAVAGPIRSACVTILVLTTPVLWGFVFFGDGEGERGSARAVYLLTIAVYIVLALIVWTRGRGVLLAALLIALTLFVLFEVGGDDGGFAPFSDLPNSQSSPDPLGFEESTGTDIFGQQSDTSTETSAVSLALGLVYLGAAWRLDRQRLAGIATPFIAVGAIFGILGALSLGTEESQIAGGLAAAGIGAVVGAIGGLGHNRRGTTWIGVIFIKLGLLAVAADVTDDDPGRAGLFALFAVGLGVIALYSAKQFKEYVDGDEQGEQLTSVRPATKPADPVV